MMHISAKRVPEHHLVEHHGAWWAYTGEPPPLEAFRSHKRPPGSKSYVWIQTAPRGERIPAGAIVEGWYTVVDGTIRVADNDDRTIGKRKLEPVRDWQQCL
jgi:hypothetical protein